MFKNAFIAVVISVSLLISSGQVLAWTFLEHSGLREAGGGAGAGYSIDADGTPSNELPSIIGTAVKAILSFVGVIFLILMIYGGYLWMTASGNEQQVEKAKNIIIRSVIGLIIVMAAYTITRLFNYIIIST